MTDSAAPPIASALRVPTPPLLPASIRRLGDVGQLIYVGLTGLLWLVHADVQPYVSLALAAYAAVTLSFLGGVHWGLAMRAPTWTVAHAVWGVAPSLVAWVSVVMPPYAGLVILGLMLIVSYLVDRRLYPGYDMAHWLTWRFRMSGVAALCCFLGAAGS